MAPSHKVAVSGANGFVARNLRRLLARSGIPAVCFARRDFKEYENEAKVVTHNYSEGTVVPRLRGCTALVHLVGIGRQSGESDYASTNVGLTKKIIGHSKRSKVRKIVFLSGLGVSPRPATDYFMSKYRAEQEVTNSGLDYTVFRPSYIIGRGDHLTASLKRQIRRGRIIVPGSGRFRMQPIHVDDACKVILQSTSPGRYSNQTVDLVGPQTVTYRRLVSRLGFKKVEKLDFEDAYRRAVTCPSPDFGVDDLGIMVGGFVGNFKRLQRLSGLEFAGYGAALEASGLP